MCRRKLGTQLAVSSTTPTRRRGNRSSTPLRMRLARATAGARYKKMESKSCSPSSCSPSRQAGCSGLSNSETWNTGATPWSLNAAQTGSKSRCESGFPSTGAGAIMASRTPCARTRAISSTAHGGIVQQEVRHAEEASVTLAADVGHEAVVGPGVRPLRGTVRGEPLLPQQPVVREQDRGVQPELVERLQARPGEAVGVGHQVVERGRRALTAQPTEPVLPDQRRALRDRHFERGEPAAPPGQPGPSGLVVGDGECVGPRARDRCGRTRSSSTRRDAGRRRWSAAPWSLPPQSTSGPYP